MTTALAPMTILMSVLAATDPCTRLADLPDPNGRAGAIVGTSGGALLFAGGTNFPAQKPWEGGAKVWYDDVFALDRPDGRWRRVGKLTRPMGYGVCVSTDAGVVCVGGGDASANVPDAFILRYGDGVLSQTPLPPLPISLANACGVMLDQTLYVMGGQQTPASDRASAAVFTLDLSDRTPQWQSATPMPGPARILAQAAVCDGTIWLMGGAELVTDADGKPSRKYLDDAWRFDPKSGRWSQVARLPHAVAAAPTPAPVSDGSIFLLGGDDGSEAAVPAARRHGFSKQVLRYDVHADRWSSFDAIPRVL